MKLIDFNCRFLVVAITGHIRRVRSLTYTHWYSVRDVVTASSNEVRDGERFTGRFWGEISCTVTNHETRAHFTGY
jgi:hypothetical protein